MIAQPPVKSYWLFNTPSRVLQADWLILENDEKATLNINMPYTQYEMRVIILLFSVCREDMSRVMFVHNVTEVEVKSTEEAFDILVKG